MCVFWCFLFFVFCVSLSFPGRAASLQERERPATSEASRLVSLSWEEKGKGPASNELGPGREPSLGRCSPRDNSFTFYSSYFPFSCLPIWVSWLASFLFLNLKLSSSFLVEILSFLLFISFSYALCSFHCVSFSFLSSHSSFSFVLLFLSQTFAAFSLSLSSCRLFFSSSHLISSHLFICSIFSLSISPPLSLSLFPTFFLKSRFLSLLPSSLRLLFSSLFQAQAFPRAYRTLLVSPCQLKRSKSSKFAESQTAPRLGLASEASDLRGRGWGPGPPKRKAREGKKEREEGKRRSERRSERRRKRKRRKEKEREGKRRKKERKERRRKGRKKARLGSTLFLSPSLPKVSYRGEEGKGTFLCRIENLV